MEHIDNRIFVAATFVALFSILPFDTGFYTFTRIVICFSAVCAVLKLLPKKDALWIPFALLGVLYNPILPVYLNDKDTWVLINLLTGVFFIWFYRKIDAKSQWTDIYLFWVGRLALIGMILLTMVVINLAVAPDENFAKDRVLITILAFATAGPIAAIAINKLFFGIAKIWLTEVPINHQKNSGR